MTNKKHGFKSGDKVKIFDPHVVDEFVKVEETRVFFWTIKTNKFEEALYTELEGEVIDKPEGWEDHEDLVNVKIVKPDCVFNYRQYHYRQLELI